MGIFVLTGEGGGISDYVWSFPGTINTVNNNQIARLTKGVSVTVDTLDAVIETAPTGASAIFNVRRGTISTGVLGASIGTVTILAGAYSGTTALGTPAVIDPTEFLVMEITQTGSGVPGVTATVFARIA